MELKNGSTEPFFSEKLQNTAYINALKPKISLKKSIWLALASSGVSIFVLAPAIVSASIFSIPAFLQSITHEIATFGSKQNSQTVQLLSPATNIDPKPSVGGGNIEVVGGVALLSQDGPSGTAADVENAMPEATAISIYTVRSGDTLGGIAVLFGVTVNTIRGANDIKNGVIHEGDTLIILPIVGIQHTVAKGDTLASIAKKYKANADEIAKYNDISDGVLAVGNTLVVPDGELVVAQSSLSSRSKPIINVYRGGSGPYLGGYYSWPVNGGIITQGLHGYNGVDIGAPTGTGILAAAAGTVIIANDNGGWNGGYGNYVVIQHDNGTQTLYSHASSLYVSAGTRVAKGATIGAVGRTGKATGPHLHFEVRGAANPFGI